MSNERKNRENDQLVTDVYKAMASEQAPDHLNQRVLRFAAREGRTRYSRARAWIRPTAWAATIGLSFAFVLELTRLPSIEADPAIGAQRSEPTTPAVARPDRVPKPDRSSKDEFAPQGMAVLREAEDMARAQAGPDQAPTAKGAEIDGGPADRSSTERVLTAPASATEPACPLEVRESAESWWLCIKALRDSGQEDLADSEYEAFQQIFPDFVDSGADK